MMIDIKELQKNFDNDVIINFIKMAIETIDENINLIKKSLKNCDIKNLHYGVHTLKSLGFLGLSKITNLLSILSDLTKDLSSFEQLNLKKFLKYFKLFEEQCKLFKTKYENFTL